jgi:hypothetical protein
VTTCGPPALSELCCTVHLVCLHVASHKSYVASRTKADLTSRSPPAFVATLPPICTRGGSFRGGSLRRALGYGWDSAAVLCCTVSAAEGRASSLPQSMYGEI